METEVTKHSSTKQHLHQPASPAETHHHQMPTHHDTPSLELSTLRDLISRQPDQPQEPFDLDLKKIESKHRKNPAYYREIQRICTSHIPANKRVLEIGCASGRLLASVKPAFGLGIDIDHQQIRAAQSIHQDNPNLHFLHMDIEQNVIPHTEPFDYIILSDLLPLLSDVQKTLALLHSVSAPHTRIIITYHSNLWRPILKLATLLGRRKSTPTYNWLSTTDIMNLLNLSNMEPVTSFGRTLLPMRIPLLGGFLNRFLAKMPFFRIFNLTWTIIARPAPTESIQNKSVPSVSVLVPTRNEKGNIEDAFTRTPQMGKWTELVFVDGNSDDGTVEEIQRCMKKYAHRFHRVSLIHQSGKGKGQAVRQGFDNCTGDILMILDSDLTMPPEELPKYYHAITSGKGEFINGCRLVYPMEKQAMRFLNMLANHTFAHLFTWLLEQPVKDTLCGTKVLWHRDYREIAENRSFFGDFDPFGDFDLLFGACKLNRKIVDMPIRYRDRSYGDIKISRFRHGLLLLKMSLVAFRKLKLS